LAECDQAYSSAVFGSIAGWRGNAIRRNRPLSGRGQIAERGRMGDSETGRMGEGESGRNSKSIGTEFWIKFVPKFGRKKRVE
jgi:hypothetical protein